MRKLHYLQANADAEVAVAILIKLFKDNPGKWDTHWTK